MQAELETTRVVAGWLATFLAHSALWIAGAWLIAPAVRSAAWRARLWRGAALGGALTTLLALNLATPRPDWRWEGAARGALVTDDLAGPQPPVLGLELAGQDAGSPLRSAAPSPASAPRAAPGSPAPARSIDWSAALVAVWLAGALVGLSHFGLQHLALGRALRSRRPLGAGRLTDELQRLLRAAGLSRPVRLSVSAALDSPVALARGEIVVPERALRRLDDAQQASLVAHELAHLARRDPHWLLALGLFERVFWFQPLLRLATRRAIAAAELCCDEAAARWTGGELALARCLAEVASWVAGRRPTRLLAGMASQPSALVERVERLLAPRPAARFQGLLVGTWSAAMLAALACSGPTVGEQQAQPGDPQAEILAERIDPQGGQGVQVVRIGDEILEVELPPEGVQEGLGLEPAGGSRVEVRLPPERVRERLAELGYLEAPEPNSAEQLEALREFGYSDSDATEATREALSRPIDAQDSSAQPARSFSAFMLLEPQVTQALDLLDECPEAGIAFHVDMHDGVFAHTLMAARSHAFELRADGSIWCGNMPLFLPDMQNKRVLDLGPDHGIVTIDPGFADDRLLRFHLAEIARCMPKAPLSARLPDGPQLPDGTLELRIDGRAPHSSLQRTLEAAGRREAQIWKFTLIPVVYGKAGTPLPFALPRDVHDRPEGARDASSSFVDIRLTPADTKNGRLELSIKFNLASSAEGTQSLGGSHMIWGPPEHVVQQLARLFADLDPELACSPVVINALPGIVYGEVAAVVDELVQAGFTDIRFVGRRER